MTKFADDSPMQFALRELQGLIRKTQFWIGLGIATVILTISGPFDTQNLLNLPERLVYWTLISITTFFMGIGASRYVFASLKNVIPKVWPRIIVSSLVSGLPITVWVWLINVYAFGFDMGGPQEFVRLVVYCVIITACVTIAYTLMSDAPEPQNKTVQTVFFDRLTKPIGTDLISLKAQDHYLEVTTTAGTELILMRLADAERELAHLDGMRIHRSHWVSKNHVVTSKRENGIPVVVLSNGAELTVSRSFTKAARNAGLLEQ